MLKPLTKWITTLWKIPEEMRIPDHLPCLLRNLIQVRKQNWGFQIVVLEETLESPLDCKEIQPVNPKGNQLWILIGRTDAEAQILWPLDANIQLIGKDAEARKDWGQEENGVTEDETVGQHNQLNGHESEQTLGHGEGQGSLASKGSQSRHDLATKRQEAAASINRIGHGPMDQFKIWEGVQVCILSPWLFNFYAEYIIWNARLNESQAGIKIAGRDTKNLRYAEDTPQMAENEEPKSLLMRVKEEREKAGLKFSIQKTN